MTRTQLSVLGAVVAALAVGGFLWRTQTSPVRNVVVITLDTTRADRLSPYGFMNISLPHLERLAREGVVFDRAMSVAPITLPAHTSLFTGLLPPSHGVRDNADTPLAESHTTLAEILKARGFRTGAFVGSIVVDRSRGLAQGFDAYGGVSRSAQDARQRPGNLVMDEAIGWLSSVGESPFFLWAHLFDAHRPYEPPEPYRSMYADRYSGELAFADSQIGRLLDALTKQNLLDRTAIIVLADHGEALGSHGERDHGIFIYEDVVRVPLIVRAPLLQPHRTSELVRLTDVMPTILEWVGAPIPAMDGVSLIDLMHGRRSELGLEAYSESFYPRRLGWSTLRALRDSRFKLIEAPRPELYDLQTDPFEEQNIYGSQTTVAQAMATRLAALAKGRGTQPSAMTPQAASEVQARLASLGYVGSATATSPRPNAPDPKDCIGTYTGTNTQPSRIDCGSWRHSFGER